MELQRGLVPPRLTPLSRQDTSLHGPALSHTFLYEALELVLIKELPSSGRSHRFQIEPAFCVQSNRSYRGGTNQHAETPAADGQPRVGKETLGFPLLG